MKLIANEKDGYCESIQIEYTPTEALIINQAMRRYVNDEEVNEENRAIMEQMLDVKPILDDEAEIEDQEDVDEYRDKLDELEREEYYESKYGKEQE